MSSVLREYLAKGVFLGLWSYLALLQPDAGTFARVLGWGLGGLALGLVAGVGLQLRRGFRPRANPPGFVLLVLLNSSYFLYAGLIGGFAWGVLSETDPPDGRAWLVGAAAAAGALVGFGLHQLRQVKDWFYRFTLGLVLGGVCTYLAIHYLDQVPTLDGAASQRQFGIYLLLGLPFFYLLTLAGEAEESEVEIAAICTAGGTGLYLLRLDSKLPENFDKLIFLIPILTYFVYSTKLLPALTTFKHNLRGYAYLSLGRYREALVSFARVLQLDRRNRLAADGVRKLMVSLDTRAIDDDTAKLLPVEYCLETVTASLIGAEPPGEKSREDALRMLDIVARQRPDLIPRVRYLRAVGLAHGRQFDAAAAELAAVLDPAEQPGPVRESVLFAAWDLALRVHPELVARLGQSELARPGRRLDAIATVERHLATQPQDPAGVMLKTELYSTLQEAEFLASSAPPAADVFNYDYVEQLGHALIADPDLLAKKDSYYYSVSLERIRGVRDKVVTWFDIPYLVRKSKQVADQREVDAETLDYGLHLARLARIVAPASHGAMLSEARLLLRKGDRDAGLSILEDVREQPRGSGDEEDAWFLAVRMLGDLYLNEIDRPDLAVVCYSAYREYQKSGADTLFLLGQAYEKSGNLNAAIKSFESVSVYPQHPRFYEAAEAVRRLKGGGAA